MCEMYQEYRIGGIGLILVKRTLFITFKNKIKKCQ
jgi:hypothetical protein